MKQMDYNRLQQAKEKATELIKYDDQTQAIIKFIDTIKENKSIWLVTTHQTEMWSHAGETFELIGEELIELLNRKVDERCRYIAELKPEDLVRLPYEESE